MLCAPFSALLVVTYHLLPVSSTVCGHGPQRCGSPSSPPVDHRPCPAATAGALFCPPPGALVPAAPGALSTLADAAGSLAPPHTAQDAEGAPIDPPAKKPRTAYNYFFDAVRALAKKQDPLADQKVSRAAHFMQQVWGQVRLKPALGMLAMAGVRSTHGRHPASSLGVQARGCVAPRKPHSL